MGIVDINSAAANFRGTMHEHPLWNDSSDVVCSHNWIGVYFNNQWAQEANVSVNLIGGICYLLHIEIPAKDRGQGHGTELYDLVCIAARMAGMGLVVQTPSGWTPSGETRRDWLLRRGWLPHTENTLRQTVRPGMHEADGVLRCSLCIQPLIIGSATGLDESDLKRFFPQNFSESPADKMPGKLVASIKRHGG